jgi:AmiR/NasT family two-component response regulator
MFAVPSKTRSAKLSAMERESVRILVIEQSEPLRATLERTLRARGGAVAGCDPGSAETALSRFQPQLVLVAREHLDEPLRVALCSLRSPASVIAMVDGAGEALPRGFTPVERPLTAGRLDAAIAAALAPAP